MNVIKNIILLPIKLFLIIIRLVLAGFIKLECHVAGVAFLFLAFCIVMTILKGTWINLGILAVMVVAVILALMIPTYLLMVVEDQLEKLG